MIDPNHYINFKHDRLKSQDAVKIAKSDFPELGTWYGFTSQTFAHLTHSTLGRSISQFDGKSCRSLVPIISEENLSQIRLLFLLISLAARYCGSFAEKLAAEHLENFYYHSLNGGSLLEDRNKSEDSGIKSLIDELAKHFNFVPNEG